MASKNRRASDRVSLLHALHAQATTYDFHVAMRRLECLYRELPRWGEAVRPSAEPIRLGQEPSMAFPTSMIHSFVPPSEDQPGSLWVRFFGLLGPNGPLPLHITEYVRDRLRNRGDSTLTAFLNLFHHRMLALFHRAWSVAQPTAAQDRPESNHFDLYVGALIGLGMPELKNRDLIPDWAKLQYAGWLAGAPPNAEGLQAILSDYFKCRVRLEEFVGTWVDLPEDGRWRLGWSREVSTLGRTSVLGRRMWRCESKFRIIMGPLNAKDFRSLLPGGERINRLAAFVRTYAGDELDFDVRLILAEQATRQARLGRGDRLGLSTHLGRRARTKRRDDVIVHPAMEQTRRSARRVS